MPVRSFSHHSSEALSYVEALAPIYSEAVAVPVTTTHYQAHQLRRLLENLLAYYSTRVKNARGG